MCQSQGKSLAREEPIVCAHELLAHEPATHDPNNTFTPPWTNQIQKTYLRSSSPMPSAEVGQLVEAQLRNNYRP